MTYYNGSEGLVIIKLPRMRDIIGKRSIVSFGDFMLGHNVYHAGIDILAWKLRGEGVKGTVIIKSFIQFSTCREVNSIGIEILG